MLLDRILFASHLHEHETLEYVVHQHWCLIARPAAKIGFFGMLLPIVFFLMFPNGMWFFAAWLAAGFLAFCYRMMDWYFDAILVTNDSVIAIDWRGFFNKTATHIELAEVEHVEYERVGFWSTVLDFGPLVISAEDHHLHLSHASRPHHAEEKIHHVKEHVEEERQFEDEEKLKELLASLIARQTKNERHGGHGHGHDSLADVL